MLEHVIVSLTATLVVLAVARSSVILSELIVLLLTWKVILRYSRLDRSWASPVSIGCFLLRDGERVIVIA